MHHPTPAEIEFRNLIRAVLSLHLVGLIWIVGLWYLSPSKEVRVDKRIAKLQLEKKKLDKEISELKRWRKKLPADRIAETSS